MPYTFNPHAHVKIWFTNNPDVFMNFENQTRFISMREKNPNDIFHLIYDSELLSDEAQADLHQFCVEFNIIPVDANSYAEKMETPEQVELYAFYKDEIRNLKAGGNLGVASDIIRLLPFSFRHGPYTDMDVSVNTNHLPATITIDAPFLMNIGSLNIFTNKEMMFILNEYIAVVDEEAAKEQIQRIHQGVLEKLKNYSADFIQKVEQIANADNIVSMKMLGYMKNRAEYAYIQKSTELNPGEGKTSSREFRAYVNEIMSDKNKYLEFHRQSPLQSHDDIISEMRYDLEQELSLIKWLFFRREYQETKQLLALNDDKFLTAMMKKERSLYLKSIVVCTTGPIEVTRSFFGKYDLDHEEVEIHARPASFSHYNLHRAFLSRNVIPLHQSVWGMLRYLGASVGELNDSSWLDEGMHILKTRGQKLQEKKAVLTRDFPKLIRIAKHNITKQINNLMQETGTVLGYVNSYRKIAKRTALQNILNLIENSEETLDLRKLRLQLAAMKSSWRITSGMISQRTNTLIEELDFLCEQAIELNIVKANLVSEEMEEVGEVVNEEAPTHIEQREHNPGCVHGLFATKSRHAFIPVNQTAIPTSQSITPNN